MQKTSLKAKMALIGFGIVLTVVLLEIGLRLGGAVVLWLQERHNHVSFGAREYRILCLGESTTALGGEDSYPSQLEEMLNQRSGVKYTVINKGIISTTSRYILGHLDQNLDAYKPQMVVVMMGINDKAYLHDAVSAGGKLKLFFENFKVYKLMHLLYEHITHRLHETPVPSHGPSNNHQETEDTLKALLAAAVERHEAAAATLICLELTDRYRQQGREIEAQQFLQKAQEIDPHNPVVYQEQGEIFLSMQRFPQAEQAFQAALKLAPNSSGAALGLARAMYGQHDDKSFMVYAWYLKNNPDDYWGYVELARWFREGGHYDLAENYLQRAVALKPYLYQAPLDLGKTLETAHQDKEAEGFYLKEIKEYPYNPRFYQAMGEFYQAQGRPDLAKIYFEKFAGLAMAEYHPETLLNYSRLADKVLERGIRLVVMQYPLRDIAFLRDYLGRHRGIIFVENKDNFRAALRTFSYSHFFTDNFAYDFGHCTRAGNALIARRLSQAIRQHQ